MMAQIISKQVVLVSTMVLMSLSCFAQEESTSDTQIKKTYNTEFYDIRGTNAVDIALGTSVMNGDFVDPMFEIYSHIGYKRHVTPHLAVDFGYHKFNLAYIDTFNEGFMSFDLNAEVLMLPHNTFSPFMFLGGGLNASNQRPFMVQVFDALSKETAWRLESSNTQVLRLKST